MKALSWLQQRLTLYMSWPKVGSLPLGRFRWMMKCRRVLPTMMMVKFSRISSWRSLVLPCKYISQLKGALRPNAVGFDNLSSI